MLNAGTATVNISPKPGIQLAGYPHCLRPNKGIHDPLYAVALYMDNGSTKKVFLTMDLLSYGKKEVKKLRDKFPDIDITASTTHTHSAPRTQDLHARDKSEGGKTDPEYISFLEKKLEEAVRTATQNTFKAEFASVIGHCGKEQGVGGNRRVKNGLQDPSVNVMAVRDENKIIRAIFLNYTLHPTFLHAENELVSADYPAYIRRYLSFAFPEASFMFAQGASGNQSSRYHRVGQDFEEAARAGTTLGVEVFHCINKMHFTDKVDIAVHTFEIEDVPMKKYPPLEEAKRLEKEAVAAFEAAKSKDYITMRNTELAMFGAQNTVAFAEMHEAGFVSPELPYEVQLIKINDTLIMTVQGEIFVEYGLEIKKHAKALKTFFLETSNGYAPGYVYTREAGEEGGYEVGTSMFAANAGEHIINKAKDKISCLILK